MKIGIIGDTHDQVQELKQALELFKKENVAMIIHTGDLVSAFTLQYYVDSGVPIKGVWGNNINDPRFGAMINKLGLDMEVEESLQFTVDGRRILILHEYLDSPVRDVDVVMYGHNHYSGVKTEGGILFINPGTLLSETFPWLLSNPSVVIYDSSANKAEIRVLGS